MHAETEISFRDSAAKALLDPQLRANFRRAMDGLMAKRRAQFPDPGDLEDLRHLSTAIRSRSLLRLPELLEQLETSCTKNGIRVHWAETCEAANELILGIQRTLKITSVVVTHDMETAFSVSSRIAMLGRGKVIAFAARDEFRKTTDPYVRDFVEGRIALDHATYPARQ